MNEFGYAIALIALHTAFSVALLKVLYKSGLSKVMLVIIVIFLTVWLATLYTLIDNRFFTMTGIPQFSFALAIVIPVVLGYIVIQFSSSIKQTVTAMTTKDLLYLQYWRAIYGLMFFFTYSLPMWFKYVGGLGDLAAGIAPFIAFQLWRTGKINESRAILYGNLVGIVDFIVVLGLGAGIVLQNQSPDIVFNLIPLYVVPLFILLHIISLQSLVAKK